MIRTVLFDLDGTILDTNELIFRSFEYVWERLDRRDMNRDKLVPYMGGKLDEMFGELTGADEAGVELMIRLYREFNLANHDELVQAFPHVEEVLRELQRAGIRMGVVTTKIRKTSEMGLKLCKLDGYIETIVSLDDVRRPKPDPEPVLQALEKLGAEAATTLMVGDSPGDVLSAKAAGVATAVVGWTLKGREEMNKYEPDYWIGDMRDLLGIAGLARDVR
ncbi:pyrophosphatase PpaX [Paenibacillus alkalitolerans]|uniref:pyrophosphatase PpaX n=1 Tax=Paenibacillus alkalitolerans TaxID=2799335 RepID=UPI0018F509EB|nr:pyrophosphatase PpaX [Paenibacillus alkalitolerans]